MKEISFYEYVSDKKINVGEISLNKNKEIKFQFITLKEIYLNPKLWTVITKEFYIFNNFERYLSEYKHHKEILLREKEIKKKSQTISLIEGNFFLLGAEENYWHFLIDFVPRLICLRYLFENEIKVVISDKLPLKFLNFIKKICILIGIKDIIYHKLNQDELIYFFDKLTFTSRPSIEFSSIFFHKTFNILIKKQKCKNLYIKRGDTKRRKVLNEDKVIEFLKNYKYEIIDCLELDIEEQIQIFSKAKNIIIPSGAAMANLLFIPDKTNVIEIRSNLDGEFSKKINLNNRFNLYTFDKTKKLGFELRKDIIVDIQSLRKLLEEKKIF